MMATYNGASYIQKQLDSILHQTITDWHLIIRDDNSNDDTVAILKNYAAKDSRISVIENHSQYHGAYHNFFALVRHVKETGNAYPFYMFVDQDDIWDTDKIAKYQTFYKEKAQNESTPLLIYGDMRLIDGQDQETAPSIDALIGTHYTNAISTFFSHRVFGCNTYFNQALFAALPDIPEGADVLAYLSHDNFLTKTAALFGEVHYYPDTVMGYRRDGQNVTSKHQYNYKFSRILKRLSAFDDLAKDHALTYKQSLAAIALFREKALEKKQAQFLDEIETIINRGGLFSLKEVNRLQIDFGKKIKNISHQLVLVNGCYKKYLKSGDE